MGTHCSPWPRTPSRILRTTLARTVGRGPNRKQPGKPDGSGPAIRLNRRHHLFLSCTLALIAAIRFSSTQSIPVGLHPGGAKVSACFDLCSARRPSAIRRSLYARRAHAWPQYLARLLVTLHRIAGTTSSTITTYVRPGCGRDGRRIGGRRAIPRAISAGSCGRGTHRTDPARSRSCPGHPRPTARRDRRSSTADHTDPDDPGSQRTARRIPFEDPAAHRGGERTTSTRPAGGGADSNRRPSAHEADELPLLHPDNGRCP